MKRTTAVSLLALSLGCLIAVSATIANDAASQGPVERGGIVIAERGSARVPPTVHNRVIRLLEEEVALSTSDGATRWESDAFDTSQFNKIGLRFSAETENGAVACWVCWRYADDEEFQDGVPLVGTLPTATLVNVPGPILPVGTRDPADLRRPDGIEDLYVSRPAYLPFTAPLDFTEVRGLEAKVRCALGSTRADYGRVEIGDDPSLFERRIEFLDAGGTLTDVKVLLRRE